jgi:hypothetical protein
MHARRRWMLAEVPSSEALARMLTRNTWTLCAAFFVTGHEEYLFLNDAMHEDGALEIGIVRRLLEGSYRQIESITFSWTDAANAKRHIDCALAGTYDWGDFAQTVAPRIDLPSEHKDCRLCK